MAMGDLCAVEFAQSSHLSVLLHCHSIYPWELLRLRSPMPRGPFMAGVVVDDLVLLERVVSGLREQCVALQRMPLIKAKYAEVGLPTNDKKEFINSTSARFWGAEVDGELGIVRPNSYRVWPLMLITMRVCCLGVCSVSLLESLCGSWISVLMFRRRCLSVMAEVFEVLHAGLAQNDIVRLSEALKDELLSLVVLGTLCYVNLRAKVLQTFRATDASDWGTAAVAAALPYQVAKEAMRFSLSRSLWSRLLPPGKAWLKQKGLLSFSEELPGDEKYDTHPLWELLARALTFSTQWRRAHTRSVHINVAELEGHLREERTLCRQHQSFRCVYGLDSQVALGALVKGCSASKSLNRLLQRSLLPMFGADAYSGCGFLPSAINRAEAPTRDREVEGPDMDLPAWWSSLVEGDVAGFDLWLEELCASMPAARDPFDFTELGYKETLEVRTGKQERSRCHFGKSAQELVQLEPFSPEESGALPSCCELCDEAVGLLQELEERGQVWWPSGSSRRFQTAGALDLYTGRGGVAKQLLKNGCPFVVTYEWNRDAGENLLWEKNQWVVLRLLELEAVKVVGSALICRSFTRAITPAVRSRRYPRGIPWMRSSMRESVAEGNKHSVFNRKVMRKAEEKGLIYWVENPDTSFLWLQRGYERFSAPDSSWIFRADFCRFGTAWRKPTRVATNSPSLRSVRMLCKCGTRSHIVLRGMHPTLRKPWTAVAEPYPRGFCSVLAGSLSSDAKWSRKLNIAGCSRSLSLRVGEASHPGPRQFRRPREVSLELMPQQLAASVALGDRCWAAFYRWSCASFERVQPLQLFLEMPLFLAHAIRRYGDLQFASGGSLLYYRHLVLAAQKRVPNLRQFVYLCWELASRWELAEPVKHRVPIPLPVLQSLISLAMMMG